MPSFLCLVQCFSSWVLETDRLVGRINWLLLFSCYGSPPQWLRVRRWYALFNLLYRCWWRDPPLNHETSLRRLLPRSVCSLGRYAITLPWRLRSRVNATVLLSVLVRYLVDVVPFCRRIPIALIWTTIIRIVAPLTSGLNVVRFIVTQLETLMVRSRKFALELIMALAELFLTSLDRVRCQIYRRSKARRCYLVDRDAIIVRENVLLVVSALQIVVLVH